MAFLSNIGKSGEVAERSPAVFSANLKEEMLYKKQLHVLNRSERSVIHQIKVDQKVLYRRFQAKLLRSRLGFARIMGQKNVEKELRSRNLGGLNTDIVSDADYGFLEKLEYRPCTAGTFSPPRRTSRQSVSMALPSPPSRTERMQNTRERSHSLQTIDMIQMGNSRPVSSSKPQTKPPRPSTTTGYRVEEQFLRDRMQQDTVTLPLQSQATDSQICTENVEPSDTDEQESKRISTTNHISNDRKQRVDSESSNTMSNLSSPHGSQKSIAQDDQQDTDKPDKRRPKTVTILPVVTSDSAISSPRGTLSRRPSRATDFFQEQEKVDIVEVRLAEAKSKNYTSRIHAFCENLDRLECDQVKPNADYYSTRLKLATDRGNGLLVEVPGTPEEENKRSVGNIHVRSLTMPFLDLNFPNVIPRT